MKYSFKNIIALVVTLSLALLSTFSAQAQEPAATAPVPKAIVPYTSYDFGDVYKGEVVTYLYIIKNVGNADLHVEAVSGCGCETVLADPVIPPGKEGKAELKLDTASQGGSVVKLAYLHTNDPMQPKITLYLSANVLTGPNGGGVIGVPLRSGKHIGPIFLGPFNLWKFNVSPGQKSKTEFNVWVEKGPINIVRVEGGDPYFITNIETLEAGKRYKIVVETVASEQAGSNSRQLRVITDSDVLPSFPIFLQLNIHPRQ